MSDLIKREDAIEAIKGNNFGYPGDYTEINGEAAIDDIMSLPSAERKGEWIDNGDRYFRCSLCGTKDTDKWHWCHGCGHPMKGAEDE